MNKILLTGATGFVGSNLTNYFENKGNFKPVPLNLREPLSLEKLLDSTVVIHLAGKAHDLKHTSDNNAYFEINTELTKQLFDLFLQSEALDFIYFSSVKAVTDTVDGILDENALPNPLTPYGKSKQLAEEYLLNKKLPKEKRLFIIRPCMIHGPGNKGNLNLLYMVVGKGIPYPLAAFDNKRSFLSIANLNYIIKRLISDPTIPGGVYNVADDEPLSTNQVIEIIAGVNGRKSRLWKINPGLIKTLASIGDKLHLPLNSERLKKLTESYVVSNEKIKRVLNIKNLPISSIQGLFTTIKSFRFKSI